MSGYDIVGAAALGAPAGKAVWLRAVSRREGDYLVTRCCVVTEGQAFPVEVRVNVPALARQLRASGLVTEGDDRVAGFGSFLKKAVKTVTKSKIVRSVGKAVGKVVKSPVFAVVNPAAAIAVHTTAKAATGKGTLKGAAGKVVDFGASAALAAAPGASRALKVAPVGASALAFVSPKALAALEVGMKTVEKARAGAAISGAAKVALAQKQAGTLPKAAARALQKNGKALAKQVVASNQVKAAVATIAAKAKAGSPEAKQAAVAILAANQAIKTQAAVRTALAGGDAGMLLLPSGKLVRSPRGKFAASSAAAAQAGTLYRGPKTPVLHGRFSAVSGSPYAQNHSPGWGGDDDPADGTDGPLGALTPPGARFELESWWTP